MEIRPHTAMRSRLQILKRLFHEATVMDRVAREAFLLRACDGDDELLQELEGLLAADASGNELLEQGVPQRVKSASHQRPEELVGETIGEYQIQQVLATGGMGTVFLATQRQPRRRVALKVARTDVLTAEGRVRFGYEAEILGLLDHACIARIYEAGIAEVRGAPLSYIAMEYVEGALDVQSFAQRELPTARGRLSLFADLCDAVHHGHQKGVVHRDLKPANILVDASGRLKVIDFGIARLADRESSAASGLTLKGKVLGTLQYMSPEQCGSGKSLDTSSDVYTLGVILYELLTDHTPYDLSSLTLLEAARVIREERSPRLRDWKSGLSGDLEQVVAKAMEKEPELRYASAAALASDVRRFLNGEPISAHPPSAAYALRKFVARHRLPVGLSVALVLLLLGFSAFLVVESRKLERQRDRAEGETRKYAASSRFFSSMLGKINPKKGSKDRSAVEAMNLLIPQIPDLVGDEPEVEAHVRETIATKLIQLGRYAEAEDQRRLALEALERQPGTNPEDRGMARTILAMSLLERSKAEEAQVFAEEGLAMVLAAGSAADVRGTARHVASRAAMAMGRYPEAEEHLKATLACYESLGDAGVQGALETLEDFASLAFNRGEPDQAIALARQVVSRAHAAYPEGDERRVFSAMYLSHFLRLRGTPDDLEEAEELQRSGLAELGRIYDSPTFYHVVWARQLGRILAARGRSDEAEATLLEAIETARGLLDDDHLEVARTRWWLADIYAAQGRSADERRQLELILPAYVELLGEDDETVQALHARLDADRVEAKEE